MGNSYTSAEIDKIEQEFLNLDLEKEKVEVIKNQTQVEVLEDELDSKIDTESIRIIKNPTNVKIISDD